MVYFHSSFYYVRYKILLKCYRLVFFSKHFKFKLALFTVFFSILFFIQQFISLLFRLVDELFYFNYRKVKISQPVYIIANPRSGTTYLHRLIGFDEQRFAYMKFLHTLFPSVSFIRLTHVLSILDKKSGGHVSKWLDKTGGKLFSGWDEIHPMGFNKPEEDEAPFALAMLSPGIFILFPFLHLIKDNWKLDDCDLKTQIHMMSCYKNSVQRFMYAAGKNKTYLSKNVMMSGRINSLLRIFPDAKFIYIIRNPLSALPSFVSMFAIMYHVHSPQIKDNDAAMQAWSDLGIALYLHFFNAMKKMKSENIFAFRYDDLMTEPIETTQKIFNHFNWEMNQNTRELIDAEISKARKFKSAHHYSLEQYGLNESEIKAELKPLLSNFNF